MFPQQRLIRIGGAILAGIFIILGAFYLREQKAVEQSGSVTTLQTDTIERSYVPYEDTDGDGQNDWESVLKERTKSATDVRTLSTEGPLSNTLTDTFARSFFEDYVRSSAGGALTDETQDAFLNASLSSLSREATDEYFDRTDITFGPDTGAYLRAYGNSIAGIIQAHSTQEENELDVFERALASEDPEDYALLQDFVDMYDSVITQTRIVAAPPALEAQHLGLLNSYRAVRNDIEGMRYGFEDPLYAALRVSRYESDMESLFAALSDIYLYIYAQGIRYTEDESGSMFKLN